MDKPLISIIINCFNSEKYLNETIESVQKQTYENWEIVFWDNQSTDNSKKIVQSYKDKRIKYYYAPRHTSLGEGRNEALKKITGCFFKFLDADDVLYPKCLEQSLEGFNDSSIMFVYTNSNIYKQATGEYKVNDKAIRPSGWLFNAWLEYYNVLLPSVLVRSSVLDNLEHNFDLRFSMIEEFDFFLRVASQGKGKYIPELTCFWRKHSESLSFVKKNKWLVEFKLLHQKLITLYPNLLQCNDLSKMEQHIAYLEFTTKIIEHKKVDRSYLRPYIKNNKKLLVTYVTSFFGAKITSALLIIVRKYI